jgi:hypothetical protein
MRAVTAEVLGRVADQHPQLESTDAADLDRPFLGGALPATPRPLTLSHLPDGWSIDSGAVHGVPEPIGDDTTELAVYPLSGQTSGAPLAVATVTRVLPDRSIVRLDPVLDDAFVYRAVVTSIPLRPLTVRVMGDDAGTAALRRAAEEADHTLVDLVDPGEPGADSPGLVVESTPGGFVITRPGVPRPLVPVVAGTGREQRTVAALEHVARWLRLSGLTNPATHLPADAVRIAVTTPGSPLPSTAAGAGGTLEVGYGPQGPPRFTVTLTNTTGGPLWAALLDLTETYGIFTDAFPAGSVALGPGESTAVDLLGQVSDALWEAGTVSVTDVLMLVTSTLEFDPRTLEQDELDVAAVPVTGMAGAAPTVRGLDASVAPGTNDPSTSLDGVLRSVRTRRATPARTGSVADWRTDTVRVVTTRPRR